MGKEKSNTNKIKRLTDQLNRNKGASERVRDGLRGRIETLKDKK